ncbi:MAG: AAA family ATPase [Pseudonocardia sp.]|nr:AAA family ATPase [Pseudonocardia sp.]
MHDPSVSLVVRVTPSAADARRGVVRLHPEVLDALGLRSWDAVTLTGARVTTALAAPAALGVAPGQATVDDVILSNAGLIDGAPVVVAPSRVAAARQVLLTGSRLARAGLTPETARLALLGKVVTGGDAVSLLPQDLEPVAGLDVAAARSRLAGAVGGAWTTELLTVAGTEPPGAVAVMPSTVVGWEGDGSWGLQHGGPAPIRLQHGGPAASGAGPAAGSALQQGGPAPIPLQQGHLAANPAVAGTATVDPADPVSGFGSVPEAGLDLDDLVGHADAARRLVEWFELTFRRPELLTRLGGSPRLGVLVVGPEGVGKATLVRSAAAAVGARCIELAAPAVAALEVAAASTRVHDVVGTARAAARPATPVVLLLTDVDALLPATDPPPLATLVLAALHAALTTSYFALVATSSSPESVDPRMRAPDLADRELGLPLPDLRVRTELLRRLLVDVPTAEGIDLKVVAERTPGFVAADLVAVRREAAVAAALRHGAGSAAPAGTDEEPARVTQQDLIDAVGAVRPISMSSSASLQTGGVTLDQVGDMVEVKQALTEAVLWPLRYPDSFARLGVDPPRGVLVYGPPGCGKTFLLRALAGTGQLNVLAVKGAELLDKYVGESERAVRELFRRAADATPALVFLDEVDALAPRRGQSSDSGVADRVVAALLTELDGAQPLRDVVVVGATNRPELIDPALLRPGRLERLIYVPPPDAAARADILRTAAARTPLSPDVDLDALGAELDGYSAADCTAVLREAALTAMRESLEATEVTATHLAAARAAVPPSLDPAQLLALEAYGARRS